MASAGSAAKAARRASTNPSTSTPACSDDERHTAMTNRYDADHHPLIIETAIENPHTDIYEKLLNTCPVVDRGDNSPLLVSRRDDIIYLNQQPSVLGNGDA